MGNEIIIQTWSRKPMIGRRQHYWRAIDGYNGKKLCGGLEGYNNEGDMLASINKLKEHFPYAEIEKRF